MADRFDVAVIGSGPGGYPAAIRLGQLGKTVCVIEQGDLGGVCLNWGCIPSKAVIHAAEVRHEATRSAHLGIGDGTPPAVNREKLKAWKEGILAKLHGGIGQLFKANGVTLIRGRGALSGPNSVTVEGTGGGAREIAADAIIVATGARPVELPFLPYSNPRCWTSKELLALDEIPGRLAIVGGGVIGLEFACAFSKLGTEVTIVELMPQLMTGTDEDLIRPISRSLKQAGVKVHLESQAKSLEERDGAAVLHVETKKGPVEVPCDRVLVAVGFKPNSQGIGLEAAGVETTDRGYIPVDPTCKTNVPTVYAIGDITGPPFLAHRATKQGIVAAEAISGLPAMCDFQAMPGGAFCDPEVATVGLSEAQAREAGHDVKVGVFPYAALGRSLAQDAPAGQVKVIGDAQTGLLLGVGAVGARANDLIAEAALALELGAHVEDLALTVHSHPTFSEAIMEAAEDFLGHAIHVARKRR